MIINDVLLCSNPLVSVVVLTYNQEQLIKQCLDTILSQKSSFEFELIIGEDCGNDGTRAICIDYQKKYPATIKLLLQDTNQGLIKNFVDLMRLCRGKYIAHCAGDDYWCDDLKLQKQVDFLENNKDYGFVRTGFYYLYPETNKLVVGTGHSAETGDVFEIAKYGPVAAAATILFKSELLKYLNFDEFIKRKFSIEDYPMQAILAKYTKFGYLPDITAVFRQTENSGSRPKSRVAQIRYLEGYIVVKRYLAELFPGEIVCTEETATNFILKKRLKFAFEDVNYNEASQLALQMKNPTKSEQKFVWLSSNKLFFYLACLYFKLKGK